MNNATTFSQKKRTSSKRKAPSSASTIDSNMVRQYSQTGIPPVKRIQTPHAHDVLSGRGGGINSHIGNQTFREWVRQRKEEYNLAPSKAEKAKIAHDVMNLVKQLDPPGRFLQRDPECPSNLNAWVEIDETRAIAKTSQALREGAPKIRAAHRDEIEQRAKKAKQKSASKRKAAASKTKIPTSTKLSTIPLPPLLSEPATIRPEPISTGTSVTVNSTEPSNEKTLMSEEVEPKYISPTKRFRMDGSRLHPHFTSAPSTPPLVSLPLPPVFVPPMTPSVPLSPNGRNAKGTVSPSENRLKRSHSLALSDLSVGEFSGGEEFVDPFADESILLQSNNATLKPPTPRGSRNVNGVEGDHSPNNGSRQKSSIGSWSTRSTAELSDLPDAVHEQTYLGGTDFGEGMKLVYDAVHPDLTSPDKGDWASWYCLEDVSILRRAKQ